MEFAIELVKILVPSAILLYAMFLVIRTFVNKEIQQLRENTRAQVEMRQADMAIKQKEVELKNKEQVLPTRLQAYERMCLFLERISPTQLVPRVNNPEFSVGLFHQVLIQEIRNEFAHNLSQQMYVSDDAWLLITKAMEEMIVLVNNSMMGVNEDAPGWELGKKVLENVREHNIEPTKDALQFLKDEVRTLF